MDWLTLLEWAAFGISLLGVYIYGESLKWGAAVCLLGAILIVLLGGITNMWGMAIFNVGFVLMHLLNIRKGINTKPKKREHDDIPGTTF